VKTLHVRVLCASRPAVQEPHPAGASAGVDETLELQKCRFSKQKCETPTLDQVESGRLPEWRGVVETVRTFCVVPRGDISGGARWPRLTGDQCGHLKHPDLSHAPEVVVVC
jgi:hypothetical protein